MFPTIDQAIANFEGFGSASAPTITAANNPGAIQAGPFATSHGAIGSSGGFAVFPDTSTGMSAVDALVQHYANAGYSLEQLINAWSPPNAPGNSPASTQNYVNSVASATGASPSTPVSSLAASPTPGFSFGCGPTQMANCANVDCGNPLTAIFSCCCSGGKNVGPTNNTPDQAAQKNCAWYDILCKINPLGGTATQSGLLGRTIAIILGLILIIAGLFMLRPTPEISVTR